MKIATLSIHDRQIDVNGIQFFDEDYFNVFYMPLSSLAGNKMHYYDSLDDERLMNDYNRYFMLQEGAYYAFSKDQLPLELSDLPNRIDAIYDDGSFYFTGIHDQERFYFLYGYLMCAMLDYEQMANGLCAAFYVVFSHLMISRGNVS